MSPAVPLRVAPPLQLWKVTLDLWPPPQALQQLSPAEHMRASRFVFEKDRRRYLAAHCSLRDILSRCTGVAAHLLRYREGSHGKPYLDNPEATCSFNMSHSEDTALILVAPGAEVGVDVEMLRPMADAFELAARNFTPSEQRELEAEPQETRHLAFLRGWTRKEACLKAVGSGLSIAPESFVAGLAPDERQVDLSTPAGRARLRVRSLASDQLTVCAIAEVLTFEPHTAPAHP